ncbi:MAG: hypothetical protein M1818_007202 [Claussenomyces sp. TS43310]|nr:MAG: hypothetical protein M1818_007202 [Claussenomyces sp. TS43310]
MRLGFDRHSNRSQQALDDLHTQRPSQASQASISQPQDIGVATSGEGQAIYEARSVQPQPYQAPFGNVEAQYIPTDRIQSTNIRNYDEPEYTPSRSQSQRYSAIYPESTSPVVGIARVGTADEHNIGDIRKSHSISGPSTRPEQPPSQTAPTESKKSKSRGVFGIFTSKSTRTVEPINPTPPSDYNNLGGLGRRASKSHKVGQPLYRAGNSQGPTARQQSQPEQQQLQHQHLQGTYQSEYISETHQPPPQETDDKDAGDEYSEESAAQSGPSPTQIHPRNQHPQPSIRLARVDQDPSFRVVEESPTHQQYLQQQQNLAQQQQRLAQHQLQFEQQHQQQLQQPVISSDNLQPSEYQNSTQQSGQYQPHLGSGNQVYTNILYRSHQSSEVVSQLSHESPTDPSEEQRPPSSATEYPSRTTSLQGPRSPGPQSNMPPPSVPNGQNRRSTDVKQTLGGSGDGRGASSAYNQQFPNNSQNQSTGRGNPQQATPQNAQQPPGAGFRESALQRERSDYGQSGSGDQGRNTPPPPAGGPGDISEFDKLVIKYKKVKGLYFERQAQVEQLQNTLANQRLSQSRTSLDDSEYATRFNRLDGAIKEIAFSIRKDWRIIPRWLSPYVNQDAQNIGSKEMTAVGRACISRWIFDEVFNRCFHPGLEAKLSAELKAIERNIRFSSAMPINQEELDALTSKVIQWKLATIDGLASQLDGPESAEAKEQFTRMAVTNLTAHLINHLQDPAPQGIIGSATSIVELAVGIATHLPRESRDISITYPLPGETVATTSMRIETGLPALENLGFDDTEVGSSRTSGEGGDGVDNEKGEANKHKKGDKGKGGPMAGIGAPGSRDGKKIGVNSQGGVETSGERERKDSGNKIRFAGFVGVEVRGRQWLVNPPVWTIP